MGKKAVKLTLVFGIGLAFLPLLIIGGCVSRKNEPCAETAAEWALKRVGSDGWRWGCLNFVANAYNQQEAGRYTAHILANELSIAGALIKESPNRAPVGALIFWYAYEGNLWAGHVGIHVGNGEVVHAGFGLVRKDNMKGLWPGIIGFAGNAPYRGWAKAPVDWQGDGGRKSDFSGRVTNNDMGIANVLITIKGQITFNLKDSESSFSVITNADGIFKLWGFSNANSYTITPSKQGYSFKPPRYCLISPLNLDVNFVAYPSDISNL